VHGVVHGDEINAGIASRVGEPCVEEHRHVVVPVVKSRDEESEEWNKYGDISNAFPARHPSIPPSLLPHVFLTNAET